MVRSGQPWENARVLLGLAEALATAGDAAALDYAARATALAFAGGFHEVALRAEHVAESVRRGHATAAVPSHGRATAPTARARVVLRTMESLPGARRYASRVAC